jgi:hypothetical protein
MTDPEGAGAVQTYLTADIATARVDAEVLITVKAPPRDTLLVPPIPVESYYFETEDYLVIDGVPTGGAPLQCRMRTVTGIGAYTYSDVPPAPADINLQSDARFLPTSGTFTEGVGWAPMVGSAFSLTCDPVYTPYLDDFYSFEVRGGDEVQLPAVVFSGDAWMMANDLGWTASAFTVALVAVLHPNPEAPSYGIIESSHESDPDDEEDTATDWGLRYNKGKITLWAGSQVVSHTVHQPLARPVIIMASIDATTGRFLVVDRNKSTRSFDTSGMKTYDVQLFLGRTGGDLSLVNTAEMDVLEFDFWARALDFDEMAHVVHELDSVYGVVG